MNVNHTVELKFGKAFLLSRALGRVFEVSPFPVGLKHLFVVLRNSVLRAQFLPRGKRTLVYLVCSSART